MQKIYLKKLIFSIIIFLILILILFFLNKEINSNLNKINDFLTENTILKNKNKEISLLNRSILEMEDSLFALSSHFVDNSNVISFLEEIEKSAYSIGLKAEVVSVKAPDSKNEGAFIGIQASGSFESLYKFLFLIENLNYELKISSFGFSKNYQSKEDLGKEATWRGNFLIEIISFIEN